MTEATAKVGALGDLFRKQFSQLQEYADADYKATTGTETRQWFSPEKDGWDGDPFNLEGLSKAFSREQHEQEFDQAVSDASSPGTVGDLVVSQLQGDTLAAMERAYRSRLRSSVRNKVHAAARRFGHGHENGVVLLGMQNYLERLIKASNTT